MRILLAISLASMSFLGSLLAQPPVPRKAPELTIIEPSGKQTLLSSYKGKVIALAFILTTCPHCQAECGVLTKLQGELGSKGFQPLAVAINDSNGTLVPGFMQTYHPSFPVGYLPNRQTVVDYLQLNDKELWNVPQVVLIDRKGMIVAQSAPKGSEELQLEDSLRKKIADLLDTSKMTSKKASH
jgi:cytochrome oxidase Cu insertion factor (SCO1/SenC/PrrC family)